MKKILIVCLILCFLVNLEQTTIIVSAEEKEYALYVDNTKIEKGDKIIIDEEGFILIPLRTVFESMGFQVTWEQCTADELYGDKWRNDMMSDSIYQSGIFGLVRFNYCNKNLVAVLEQSCVGIGWNISVTEEGSEDETDSKEFLPLNAMGAVGGCEVINDRIYLYEDTFELLMQGLNGKCEVDEGEKEVRITKSETELPEALIEEAWKRLLRSYQDKGRQGCCLEDKGTVLLP